MAFAHSNTAATVAHPIHREAFVHFGKESKRSMLWKVVLKLKEGGR